METIALETIAIQLLADSNKIRIRAVFEQGLTTRSITKQMNLKKNTYY